MQVLYNIFIYLYSAAISVAALFYNKAKLLHSGRRKIFNNLAQQCDNKQIVWFHCASLGEYEQGKPLIQKFREQYPDLTFLVTFFSPSGYEVKKNDKDIDILAYLPSDTPKNARKFIQTVKPKAVFFVKYEYWYNFINELYINKIPFYYLSAIFRSKQYFFQPYGRWFAEQLKKCTYFFVQNKLSQILLNQIGIEQVAVTGDTRFDRVYHIAQKNTELDFMREFKQDTKLIIAGSSWQPDEELLNKVFESAKNDYKIVLAPHLIDPEHITSIKQLFGKEKVVCYTQIEGKNLAEYNVLIIDTIGILRKIYKYADIAYIGGAFGTGLHNTLEAAVFGIPLFFGPEYDHFNEAVELVTRKGAFSIVTSEEMIIKLRGFKANPDYYKQTCQICAQYVHENLGACDKIAEYIHLEN